MIKNAELKKRYQLIKTSGEDAESIKDQLAEIVAIDIMLQKRAENDSKDEKLRKQFQRRFSISKPSDSFFH